MTDVQWLLVFAVLFLVLVVLALMAYARRSSERGRVNPYASGNDPRRTTVSSAATATWTSNVAATPTSTTAPDSSNPGRSTDRREAAPPERTYAERGQREVLL